MAETNGRVTWQGLIQAGAIVLAVVGAALSVGYKLNDLTTEVRLLRSDLCQYAVPQAARPFAYSCRETHSGLQAQEP